MAAGPALHRRGADLYFFCGSNLCRSKVGKIQTQDIEAKDLIINEEVQEKNGGDQSGEKVIPISPSLVWIPVMEILERETARTVLL